MPSTCRDSLSDPTAKGQEWLIEKRCEILASPKTERRHLIKEDYVPPGYSYGMECNRGM